MTKLLELITEAIDFDGQCYFDEEELTIPEMEALRSLQDMGKILLKIDNCFNTWHCELN